MELRVPQSYPCITKKYLLEALLFEKTISMGKPTAMTITGLSFLA